MKYLIWIIALFSAAVALAAVLHNSAYVLLVYPPYRIELSFSLFTLLLIGCVIFLYALVKIVNATLNMPNQVREFSQRRTKSKSRETLDEVLSAYFEGRYGAAEKAATQAMKSGETSALYPIIAARAAHELHEYGKRDALLESVGEKTIGDSTMRLMSSTKFMLDQDNPREVMDDLRKSNVEKNKD
ncbi:MAG: heme biosynthesis HemY N-terminal domain-containing protein [Gallionella sp.]